MRRARIAVAVTVGMLAVTGCSDLQGTDGKEWITGEAKVITVPEAERVAPVEASGEDLDGDDLAIEDYRDRVVVLNVWAQWCPPCRKEMPLLVDVVGDLGDDAVLVGINVRETGVDNARAFMRTSEVDFPSFYDPGSEILLALTDKVGPYSLPSTVVLDREGRMAALVLGEIPSARTMSDVIDDVVDEVVAEPPVAVGG